MEEQNRSKEIPFPENKYLVRDQFQEFFDEIDKMTEEEYKEFDCSLEKIVDCDEDWGFWDDNFEFQFGDTYNYQYHFPYFPYFSIEIIKESNKIKVLSLGIFKDKLYIVLDIQ